MADEHLTGAPLESIYSGLVSLCGFHMVMFLTELNDLEFWATNICNAYLESHMAENVYIVSGEEFEINTVTSLSSADCSMAFDPVDNNGITVSLTALWSWDSPPARPSLISS